MGKKTKIGRQRKDKFYQLAKETGYRSRAAFKLIQLNRKFEFLQKSRVLIDLCAAPGGWMQVAKQNMPVSSVVIGVDMYPMKSIPGCITLLEDITTDKCRVSIHKELKTWKADVVLHDGAPNVGKNWLHDAYNQSCLTLSALKLATSFLREGGWFITKIFRSKDYNCLLWVFKNLFKKVHATKPQASRSESAEIFVVCKHYLAPKKVNPQLLNPSCVFKEIEADPQVSSVKLGEERKKKKAEGYPDDVTILYNKLPASEFLESSNPAFAIQNASEIEIDTEEILNHPKTTEEIKRCCEDIKVLGKKELRSLVAWWKVFKDERKQMEKQKEKEEEEKRKESLNTDTLEEFEDDLEQEEKELEKISKDIAELEDEERKSLKRKKKKVNKEKAKLNMKMNLKMKLKDDPGPTENTESELFKLSQIKSLKALSKVTDRRPDSIIADDEEKEDTKLSKVKYNPAKSCLHSSGRFYQNGDSEEENNSDSEDEDSDKETLGFSTDESEMEEEKSMVKPKKHVRFADEASDENNEDSDDVAEGDDEEEEHPLLTDLDYRKPRDKRAARAELWFDKDVFKGIEEEEDEDYELDKMASVITSLGGKVIGDSVDKVETETSSDDDDEDDGNREDEQEEEVEVSNTNSSAQKELKPLQNEFEELINRRDEPINEWDVDGEQLTSQKKKKKREKRSLDDKGLALGSMMVESKRLKRDLIDGAWNRYAFNDENLPDWFVEEEKKHMRKEAPVPKELSEEYKKREEEINVRPIKKVAEAKARKKKRAMRKLEKAKKKLEGVMENPDVSTAEKARQIKQIYKKLQKPKPEVTYVVAKKHTTVKRARRPRGIKGPYKVVDPRMKKDLRAKISKMTKKKSKTEARKIRKSFKPNAQKTKKQRRK